MITQFILLSQVFWAMSLLRSCEAAIIDSSILRFDPPNVNVLEGNDVTLSCVVSKFQVGEYIISWNNQTSRVRHPQENCTVSGPLSNTQEYKVGCFTGKVQITILHVSRERHGEVWTCQRNIVGKIYESNSTFSVNARSTQDESLSSSINTTPSMVGVLVGSAIFIAGVCTFICVWILCKRKHEETNQTYQVVFNQQRDATYDDTYRVSNSEIGTAASDSRTSSATTSETTKE